jgi:hypothetical protein
LPPSQWQTHKSQHQQAEKEKNKEKENEQKPTTPTPTQSKHPHIFKWLQGLRSMSSILSSSSKTRDEDGSKTRDERDGSARGESARDEDGSKARESEEESSVEVVAKARDAKGRAKDKGIRVVSNEEVEVEEGGGVGGGEREV